MVFFFVGGGAWEGFLSLFGTGAWDVDRVNCGEVGSSIRRACWWWWIGCWDATTCITRAWLTCHVWLAGSSWAPKLVWEPPLSLACSFRLVMMDWVHPCWVLSSPGRQLRVCGKDRSSTISPNLYYSRISRISKPIVWSFRYVKFVCPIPETLYN